MYKTIEQKKTSNCLNCGTELYGRSDKKFCGQQCRNAFHNNINSGDRKRKEGIVNSLYKNYCILDNIIKSQRDSADLWDLERVGYKPELVTGFHVSRNHTVICYCFDISFRQYGNRITRIRKTESLSVVFRELNLGRIG